MEVHRSTARLGVVRGHRPYPCASRARGKARFRVVPCLLAASCLASSAMGDRQSVPFLGSTLALRGVSQAQAMDLVCHLPGRDYIVVDSAAYTEALKTHCLVIVHRLSVGPCRSPCLAHACSWLRMAMEACVHLDWDQSYLG